ncbi:MAG: hypothetical protein EOP46_01705 [Sphingobacteriaceae bacterium]|nr:MAG: hypothetical protein EOP46_01705 [Sphingobacteriaceae bacterium]
MKLKIYKQALVLGVLLVMLIPAYAQLVKAMPVPPTPAAPPKPVHVSTNVNVNLDEITINLARLNTQITPEIKRINKEISLTLNKSLASLDVEISKSVRVLSKELSNIKCDVDVDVDVDDANIDADAPEGDLEELTKTYSKSYQVDVGDVLDIDNRYGKVTVSTWNKNEFKVDVFIKVATTKEGAAKKMLDDVTIQDGKQGSTVWFKTKFAGDQGTSSWSFNGKRSVRIMEINYTIYMPAKNAITINNKYGTTVLPNLYGKVNVTNAYGKFYAKSLNNISNNLNLSYTDASIDELKSGNVNFSYGDLKFGKVGTIDANIKYSPVSVNYLTTSGNFNIKYGQGLKINELGIDMKSLNINTSYSGVGIQLNGKDNFDFDVTVRYNNFNHNGGTVKVVSNTPEDGKSWTPTKNFKGTVGKGNSDKLIVIKANYAGVSFE